MNQGSTAASSIGEHLSSPSSLSRIILLRERILKERSSLQSSLSSRAKDQVDNTRKALQGLRNAKNQVQLVKEGMIQVDQTMADPKSRIQGFGKLLEVSLVHKRFVQALEMVTSLRGMYSRLSHISDLLALDSQHLLGPSPNLLPIHYHLTELETFRNETLAQARRSQSSAASKRTLEQYFERLGTTIDQFELHYFKLCGQFLALARAGNAAVAVKIAKIAVLEGTRDKKALEVRTLKGTGTSDVAMMHKSMQAEARTIKNYKEKVIEAIELSCKLAIEASFAKYHEDGIAWIEDLDWIFDDLVLVEKELISRFPEDWKIHEIYARAYHMALYNFLNHYVKTSPDAGSLLRLAQFTKEYKKSMTQELSIPATILTPPLLDGKEQDLIEVYVMLLVKKMDEWTANLMRTEVNDFLQREAQPEVDVDGYYGMQGAVILFQMLNQQIDLALDSNQGAILLRIVEELNRVTKGIQQQWMKLLDSELKKATGDKVVDVKPGFVEYAMALANDQIKSADFTEALNIRLEPLVSNKYKNQINEKLNDTMDGFLDVAKKCVQVLIDIIFHDLKPAVKSLLSTAWYVEDPMAQMIDTLRDYMDDYQSHLNTNLFELLIEDIIDTFLIHYLVAIRKCSKLKIPAAVNKMKEDQNQAFTFFANYKPRRELEGYFDVFDSVLKLISSSKMMVYLDYWPFRQKYGVNLAFVEGIMRARDDLDKSAVSDILDSVKRKVASDTVADPEIPSIFTRLPIK